MTSELLLYASLAGLFGGFMNGFAGTGTALFGLGFLLVALAPPQAVLVIATVSVLAGCQGLWVVRSVIPGIFRRILLFVIPGLLGIPIGLLSLQYVSAETLRLLVAVLLIVYGAYFGFRKSLPRVVRPMPILDGAIGFFSGILGGLASLSGAFPAIWLSLRDWPKAETRAVMQSFNVSILACTAISLMLRGAFTGQAAWALGIALPVGLVAAQIGIWLYKRLTDTQFRRSLIFLCLAMGVGILLGAIF